MNRQTSLHLFDGGVMPLTVQSNTSRKSIEKNDRRTAHTKLKKNVATNWRRSSTFSVGHWQCCFPEKWIYIEWIQCVQTHHRECTGIVDKKTNRWIQTLDKWLVHIICPCTRHVFRLTQTVHWARLVSNDFSDLKQIGQNTLPVPPFWHFTGWLLNRNMSDEKCTHALKPRTEETHTSCASTEWPWAGENVLCIANHSFEDIFAHAHQVKVSASRHTNVLLCHLLWISKYCFSCHFQTNSVFEIGETT